ncbi:MAG: hypothetical protein EA364_15275 [Balneolaceae bacterium]|nr:MAG: hypothetical protein EA364_15275 [Balneolaceae bacterium]
MRATTLVILAFFIMVFIAITVLWFINRPHNQRVTEIRSHLTALQGDGSRYDTTMISGLPGPAIRYFRNALGDGVSLPRRIEVVMRGEIRTGPESEWMPFEGRQVLARNAGFLWEAEVDLGAMMWLKGADYYYAGEGRVWFSLNSLIPVVTASGPFVDRSAAGRLLIEQVLIPSALLPLYGAEWTAVDDHHAEVLMELDGVEGRLTLRIDDDGQLVHVVMPRVQGDEQGNEVIRPFGVRFEDYGTFDGISIPSRIAAGWEFGTDDYFEFFIAEFVEVSFY